MNKLIRKLAYWFFKNKIKKFGGVMVMSDEMLSARGRDYVDYAKRDMVRNIADALYKEGAIHFTEEKTNVHGNSMIRAEIYVLK